MTGADHLSCVCKRILFCTDFSSNAQFAFQFALSEASRFPNCTLHLLHVIPEVEAQFWKTYLYEIDGIDEKAKQDTQDKIAEDYLPHIPERISSHVEIRVGKDYQTILEYAREIDCDLIVIGRQGQSNLRKVLFGNVTEKVTRHAECPVLVVPLVYQTKQ
ncbi:MAG: universal stress protein [Candidatus Omnitrophica bacterium]|nr:universal stress protein [Candidatus Omnitrophota bacterium]